jgi:hypothetical protein
MKKKIILAVLILVIFCFGLICIMSCFNRNDVKDKKSEVKPVDNIKYNISTINFNENPDYFKSGVYYQYNFSDDLIEVSKELNLDSVFEELLNNNIIIEEVWYKSYKSSCCPSENGICMEAIVFPELIVKMIDENYEIEKFNFIKKEIPDIGWCAHNVIHYVFK